MRAAALAVVLVAGAAPALACTVGGDYRTPTNLDLAVAAEVIVIATVAGERAAGEFGPGAVFVVPTSVIKGPRLPAMLEIPDATLDDKLRRPATRSDPRELRKPNPDAMAGGCVRLSFTRGMKLVLFLKRDRDGVLQPYRSAFSRDAEDVSGDGALWVRAVQEYAAISFLPRYAYKRALKRRIAALRAAADQDSIAIADDLAIELAGRR
jgi:hypothetical protein